MDKQKQIEEMAKDMLDYGMGKYPTGESVFTETKLREQFYYVFLTYAEYLIKKGYCKIPEGAVVLTKEELEQMAKAKMSAINNMAIIASQETAERCYYGLASRYYDKEMLEIFRDYIAKEFGFTIKE